MQDDKPVVGIGPRPLGVRRNEQIVTMDRYGTDTKGPRNTETVLNYEIRGIPHARAYLHVTLPFECLRARESEYKRA
eukprot:620391-Pyramimonas_sp.AAC.1